MANPPKVPIAETNPVPASVQDQITLALLANGGIPRIQAAFRQRLDEAGWSENLRNYVTGLFRSGECTTFFEAMEKVKERVGLEGRDGFEGELVVPRSVGEEVAGVVRRELEGICEMGK
ncbi:hypothetical protein B0A48_06052 [Cryoendolithus antarcticus]|uniref:Uncharacterized protein n=1 Tax=Cryoendolithus antarcticus TaxID=1507870 RepID=A0A1V8TD42_9PEZI|nr:hypothetical protein B0A48_06052 [Cryoendolithus antarcticus]